VHTPESSQPTQKLILSLEEASALLGMQPSSLYEMTRARARVRQRIPIPHIRLGRRLGFRRESLERWIAQLEDAVPTCSVVSGGAR
jgi:predicted DNA-binding transcriptional regulator AlpA